MDTRVEEAGRRGRGGSARACASIAQRDEESVLTVGTDDDGGGRRRDSKTPPCAGGGALKGRRGRASEAATATGPHVGPLAALDSVQWRACRRGTTIRVVGTLPVARTQAVNRISAPCLREHEKAACSYRASRRHLIGWIILRTRK